MIEVDKDSTRAVTRENILINSIKFFSKRYNKDNKNILVNKKFLLSYNELITIIIDTINYQIKIDEIEPSNTDLLKDISQDFINNLSYNIFSLERIDTSESKEGFLTNREGEGFVSNRDTKENRKRNSYKIEKANTVGCKESDLINFIKKEKHSMSFKRMNKKESNSKNSDRHRSNSNKVKLQEKDEFFKINNNLTKTNSSNNLNGSIKNNKVKNLDFSKKTYNILISNLHSQVESIGHANSNYLKENKSKFKGYNLKNFSQNLKTTTFMKKFLENKKNGNK